MKPAYLQLRHPLSHWVYNITEPVCTYIIFMSVIFFCSWTQGSSSEAKIIVS